MISHLFKNGIIVTVNPDREIFFHGAVAVKDDRIVEVGPTEAMEAKYTDCERVTDLEGRVMFPGFVNTHNHLFQTLLRGLGDDMVLKDWLETMTFPAATNLTPDDCYHGAMLGLMDADVKKYIFDEILPQNMIDGNTKFFINPTGRFVIGGPQGDSGLTGRKIIVDTYGGYARHGGGAFSGKDCTKVDRSAAYAARYVAKNIVAAGLADKCEIQLSYAIGVAHPTSIMVDTYGTGKLSNEKLVDIIRSNFDLRPAGIIKMLDLRRPIYKQTAAYGHFGRNDLDLPWERLDIPLQT